MPKITIPQKNLTLDCPSGENLMHFLQSQDIPVASSCLGDGVCSMCKMKIIGNINPPLQFEVDSLLRNKCSNDERLSCQIVVTSDLIISTKYW